MLLRMGTTAFRAETYHFNGLDTLASPRLLVYRERVEDNVARMKQILEDIVPGSGFHHLCPHVKTHKSTWVARLLLESGVRSFKCTPNELAMLLAAGAKDVFVAYPLLSLTARKVLEQIRRHPGARVLLQIGGWEHAQILAAEASQAGLEVECLLDLDVGEGRTGMNWKEAVFLAEALAKRPEFTPLHLIGLHAYNGANHDPSPSARDCEARRYLGDVVECFRRLEKSGQCPKRVIVGGSLDFAPSLHSLVCDHRLNAEALVSPGTWVYWDARYAQLLPETFRFAALLLARVMDTTSPHRVTLDMGYKRWGSDQGNITVLSEPGWTVASSSEEHTVLTRNADETSRALRVGDVVLCVPEHVCSTVNLWEEFTLVGPNGIEEIAIPVCARNR